MAKRGAPAILADYLQISKPRILALLLVVAWAAMFVAAGGVPEAKPFVAVTIAGAASTAASGAFNNVLERDRDARMGRTSSRPVASGRVSPLAASIYGALMVVVSIAPLAWLGLWIAAALTLAATFYYVVVYTVVLKPRTPQNIVIGGLAGSFPAVIGWAAATGGLGWPGVAPALVLALIVFLWTPAHFWSLALLYKDDYAAADYPMMPNVRGEASTRRQIFAYSILTAAASLVVLAFDAAAWIYLAGAVVLGGLLVVRSWRLLVEHSPKKYRAFFLFTIQYLGLLLVVLMADRVIPQPAWPF